MLIVENDSFQFVPSPLDPRSPDYSSKHPHNPPTGRITYGTLLHRNLWRSEVPWDQEMHDDFMFHSPSTGDRETTGVVPHLRFGTLHKGLLRDEFGEWNQCTLRGFLIGDLKRIGRTEAIRRKMISYPQIQPGCESIASVLSDSVKPLYESLCDVLLRQGSNPGYSDSTPAYAADIGTYRFIRYCVFWVDLISKIRSLPCMQPARATAYPSPYECGGLLPLWQLILIKDGDGEVTEVVQVVSYAAGRSLLRLAGRNYLRPLFPVHTIKSIMRSLSRSLMLMHMCGYGHRDVTPTNVLFLNTGKKPTEGFDVVDAKGNRWAPVLADFESLLPLRLGQVEGGWSLGWNGGTRSFSTPPEAFETHIATPRWGLGWDLWGLGSVCFALLWGRAPFWGESNDDVSKRIIELSYAHPDGSGSPATSDTQDSFVSKDVVCECSEMDHSPFIYGKDDQIQTYRKLCSSCRPEAVLLQTQYVDNLLIRDIEKRVQWCIELYEQEH